VEQGAIIRAIQRHLDIDHANCRTASLLPMTTHGDEADGVAALDPMGLSAKLPAKG